MYMYTFTKRITFVVKLHLPDACIKIKINFGKSQIYIFAIYMFAFMYF